MYIDTKHIQHVYLARLHNTRELYYNRNNGTDTLHSFYNSKHEL